MDRDYGAAAVHGLDDLRARKGRLMGKLFGGRERKASNELREGGGGGSGSGGGGGGGDDEINAFLHGSSGNAASASANAAASSSSPRSSTTTRPSFDGFQVTHAAPPQLAKLDTRSVSRYPNALPLTSAISLAHSPTSAYPPSTRPSKKRSKKGYVVRFVDTFPEIIGEGGDEAETPTVEIGKRRRARSARSPVLPLQQQQQQGSAVSMSAASSRSMPMRSPLPPLPPGAHQQQQQQQQQRLQQQQPQLQQKEQQHPQRPIVDSDIFTPGAMKRRPTGYSINEKSPPPADWTTPTSAHPTQRRRPAPLEPPPAAGHLAPSPSLDPTSHNEKRRSFIEIHQAEMREAEGRALTKAVQAGVSPPTSPETDETKPSSPAKRSPTKMTPPPPLPPPRHPRHAAGPGSAPYPDYEASPILPPPSSASTPDGSAYAARSRQVAQEYNSPQSSSPTASVHRALNAFRRNANSRLSTRNRNDNNDEDDDAATTTSSVYSDVSTPSPKAPMANLHDVVQAAAEDALDVFVARSRHLFALFRLQSETVRPLTASSIDDLARAALWWFLVGRMALERSFRERATPVAADSPTARSNEFAMQQAYADLAKAFWLIGEVLPERLADKPPALVDKQVEQVRAVLFHNLRKVAMSMKRNDLLPPEDAFLPQIIDKAIWLTYPPVSSDVTALLCGHWGSSMAASPVATPPLTILEALPIADTAQEFVFSRLWVDVYLMEQGRDSSPHPQQQLQFPCMLSVARPQNSVTLEVVLASQNGTVQLRVQGKKNAGPTWDDVRWRPDMQSLEIRMPRGFLLVIQLSKQDYGLLWSMYDFGAKVNSQLYPRKDEQPVFHTTLKAFQYFESGQQTSSFPKEAVPDCDVALFEKTLREGAATGPRTFHRGFRLAVVSGTHTRTLYGVSHLYTPDVLLQFSFLRGDQGDPALLLRFENARSKGSMVLSFDSGEERMRLHNLLAGTAVHNVERVFTDVPMSALEFRVASRTKDGGSGGATNVSGSTNNALSVFKKMAFQRLRVINYDDEAAETRAATVLAEHLRMVLNVGDCTIVDRVNVAPGELKIRLDVRDSTCLMILRQAQEDLTVAVSDAQVSREASRELADGLRVLKTVPTCRMLRFAKLSDLHAVQTAMTGYHVLFDGVASTFAIARRRMVVPIHKKWEAGATRIQVVVHPDTKITQLLAFFQDFHYGRCMSFQLKGTDMFESFGRGTKCGIKFDDAKFPLPRMPAGESSGGGGGGGGGMESGAGAGDWSAGGNVECSEAAFVCLDMPDLPGEHDDISILFDNEADRDRLASCLPAPVRGSRLNKMFQ
ncbi:hypothetical protein SPI_03125 [Niveomyces insectorum RCEF 264]|uniref:Uncharacterized protein n=1 Tax=Niveomyces insectorum RCEF 264 TaxID=1081102 RepID=A0A167X3A4_9HYPO|nr:hypothetical protein SPI_03125 [Niveomyces insectorum RCEF 264]